MSESGSVELRFRVLLIGGNSGAGKTSLARRLGAELGVSVLNADDLRVAAKAVTSLETRPELHYSPRDASVWGRPVEELVEACIRAGRVMGPPPAQVALNHMTQTDAGPVIIEGDCAVPSLEGEIEKLASSRGIRASSMEPAGRSSRSGMKTMCWSG